MGMAYVGKYLQQPSPGFAGCILMTMTANNEEPARAAGDYPLGPSRYLAAILTVGHLSVAALLLFLDFSPAWKIPALALLLVSLIYELRVALRFGVHAVTAFRVAKDGAISIRSQSGEWRGCAVLDSSYVTAFLTVVNLRATGERRVRSVIILPDCMAADDYRRLRVWLRWRPQAAAN